MIYFKTAILNLKYHRSITSKQSIMIFSNVISILKKFKLQTDGDFISRYSLKLL